MSKLINIGDLEFIQGRKFNLNSTLLKAGLLSLKRKKLIKEEGFEKVVSLPELILELYTLSRMLDKRNNNKNGKK